MVKNLKQLRKNRGLTQDKLAKIINISRSAISMYEIGESEPDFAIAIRLADFFNVSIDCLIGRDLPDYTKITQQAVDSEKEHSDFISCFNNLNTIGRTKLLTYGEGLSQSKEFKK